MYHVGTVLKLIDCDANISADGQMQAVLEMWDKNIVTLLVHPALEKDIKINDIVLVDYRPKRNTNAPNMMIIKILKGKNAKEIYKIYKEHLKRKEERRGLNQAYIR